MILSEWKKIINQLTDEQLQQKLYFVNKEKFAWGKAERIEIAKENMYYDDEMPGYLWTEIGIKEMYGGEIPDWCELEIPKGSLVIII